MKKKMQVFLRLSKKAHPLYEELTNYPPKNIEYVCQTKAIKDLNSNPKMGFLIKLRNFIWNFYLRVFLPIIPLTYKGCDLIHSTNSLTLISNKPWIVDAETGHGLVGFEYWKIKSPLHRFFIKRVLRQKNCKKITVFSEMARKSFLHFFGNEFKEKVVTLYPAQHLPKKVVKIKNDKVINLLFIARKFEEKGGYETIDTFNRLRKIHKNIKLTMVSIFPKEILKKYSKDKNFKLIWGNLPKNDLLKYYQSADVFVYPSRIDANYGMVLTEAMANKLPIVTTNIYAVQEAVEDKKNGFLVNPLIKFYDKEGRPLWNDDFKYLDKYRGEYNKNQKMKEELIKSLSDIISKLIRDEKLRKKMGEEGFKMVSKGKFSIEERNKKLERIYEEALK